MTENDHGQVYYEDPKQLAMASLARAAALARTAGDAQLPLLSPGDEQVEHAAALASAAHAQIATAAAVLHLAEQLGALDKTITACADALSTDIRFISTAVSGMK